MEGHCRLINDLHYPLSQLENYSHSTSFVYKINK